MCGIAGFLGAEPANWPAGAALAAMIGAVAHRGPDDEGVWRDESAGIALGQRRLAVIDLSAAGHQPMVSASGRYVVTYNGEIYNYRALRATLEQAGAAPAWRGHSDTEVMLAAFDHWGVSGALERLNGMFAIALWDRQERRLILARDRLGEKPLYYGHAGASLLFGSELKALAAHPDFRGEVDREALTQYLRYAYVPAPRSIWRGVWKLPPGHYVEIADQGRSIGTPVAYWDFPARAAEGAAAPLPDGPALIDELEALLKDSVLLRMEADVPLGAFLSGGVDSSLIVALMQAQSARKVRTFTIGFHEQSHNEAEHAAAVAAHLGTEHTELYVTAADALALVPRLPEMWDEPFADSSQIPTHLVSALTRQHVTVGLSGDGGDELFGGYNRYLQGMRVMELGRRLGPRASGMLAALLRSRAGIGAATGLMRLAPARRRHLGLADRLPRIGLALEAGSPEALYRRLVAQFDSPSELVLGGGEPAADAAPPAFADFRQTMMYLDTMTYLPDDILTKVDRASMAVALESRVPYLDHRVVELAWRLPMSAKIRDGKGKWILREILDRYVPRSLIERPKMGFAVPVGAWLNGALRDWAEDLLDPRRLASEGFFEPSAVRALWDSQKRHGGQQARLWTVLMFQAWWREQESTSRAAQSASFAKKKAS